MLRLIFLGLLAGAFFSSTFVLNELMSGAGGHWFWSASLRYVFMFLMLSVFIALRYGMSRLTELTQIFIEHWRFWCVTGGVGFGLFYAGICFAGDHASGWVVASTFMFTVVASLFVLYAFGQRFSKQIIVFAMMIFIGVVLVNLSEASHTQASDVNLWHSLIFGALPAFVAAFCYPIGNQLVWQASHNAKNKDNADKRQGGLQTRIPIIDTNLLNNAFNKIWLMTVGSFPLWLLLGLVYRPSLPSYSQAFNTFLVALFSGIIATGLFLYAREHAKSTQEVAGVDATQASEVIFALIGGMILLNTPFPSFIGLIGIGLIVTGLVLFSKYA
ncbi:multidrug resistance efflux transporter family protein [Psychrobacter sp. HD31]|uniref:multidrug resistance efflux transporter family protein n=1 Tax=Psychrobacter sp. HD31 TaxID=3112003 RepID=UPI003DA2BB2D